MLLGSPVLGVEFFDPFALLDPELEPPAPEPEPFEAEPLPPELSPPVPAEESDVARTETGASWNLATSTVPASTATMSMGISVGGR